MPSAVDSLGDRVRRGLDAIRGGEIGTRLRRAKRRFAAVVRTFVPDAVRRRLTVKLALVLLAGALVSGLLVFSMFGGIQAGLSEQVEAQVESETTLQGHIYEQWLGEQLGALSGLAEDDGMQADSAAALDEWSRSGLLHLDSKIAHLSVVDRDTGEVLGSSTRSLRETNVYDHGLDESTASEPLFASTPVDLADDETVSFLGIHGEGDRMLVAGVPTDTTLVSGASFDGSRVNLVSMDGEYIFGQRSDADVALPAAYGERSFLSQETHVKTGDDHVAGFRAMSYEKDTARRVELHSEGDTTTVVLVRTVPNSEAFALQDHISSDIITALVVVFLILIGTSAVMMRSVTADITDLSKGAREISDGSLDTELESNRIDEIGVVYRSFGDMRDSLKERITEAEQAADRARTAKEEADEARAAAQDARESAERMNRHLEQRAAEYSDDLGRFAAGDLTVRMDVDERSEPLGEIAASFNEMAADLAETMLRIREFADEVTAATDHVTTSAQEVKTTSQDVSRSMQEIADGTQRQDENVQAASDRIADQSDSMDDVSTATHELATTSESMADLGGEGREYASRATDRMHAHVDLAEEMLAEIQQLHGEIAAIGDIVTLIEEIADQTNMLALNASIEAARAGGDSGEGFAVVADEIKSLAGETQEAIDEIEEIIGHALASTDEVVSDVEEMRDEMTAGIETVDRADEVLDSLVEEVRDVDRQIQEISSIIDEETESARRTRELVEEVGAISTEVSASATNVAGTAEEQTSAVTSVAEEMQDLSERADRLSAMIDEFDVEERALSEQSKQSEQSEQPEQSDQSGDSEQSDPDTGGAQASQ